MNTPNAEGLVLIVDDSPDMLGLLNEAFEETGMTTLVALEGTQAIKIAKKMRPTIILLDAIMPNMDGFETCRQLKLIPEMKDTPIIFMTGLTDTESIVKGFAAGGVDYLTKPINPQELIARVNVHLLNARKTLSAQLALDSAGQNILAVNTLGQKLWATPAVNHIFAILDDPINITMIENTFKQWLKHIPSEGSRLDLPIGSKLYTAIYFVTLNTDEHLIRLIDDTARDEASILQAHFDITKRESEVFLWIARGKTNREIALIIDMSPRTVNKHLEQLFKKLDVDNRTSAASKAIQQLNKTLGHV